MNIEIPFYPDMAKGIVRGYKTATSRTKVYGLPGDTFLVKIDSCQANCCLTEVKKIELEYVAFHYYADEGFNSPASFIERWCQIHPIKHYIPSWEIYFHRFIVERKTWNG